MYYIIRKQRQHGTVYLNTAKETGCRTLALAEAWVEKEAEANADPRHTYIITEAVMSFSPTVTIKKTKLTRAA